MLLEDSDTTLNQLSNKLTKLTKSQHNSKDNSLVLKIVVEEFNLCVQYAKLQKTELKKEKKKKMVVQNLSPILFKFCLV